MSEEAEFEALQLKVEELRAQLYAFRIGEALSASTDERRTFLF
jgi:hypothetical protein